MIPWEKQGQEFRQYWLPADGREVDHTTRYFALISGLSADSPNAASVHVNVPDLRGMFLRGINAGRSDQWKDPEGERTPGSSQMDDLRAHNHALPSKHLEASGGGGFNGWGYDSDSNPNPARNYSSSAAGGAETRPKNVAIYYYIRIN